MNRRHSIACDLICCVLGEVRRRGCAVVQVTAPDAGDPLYESCGFAAHANFRQLVLEVPSGTGRDS